MEDNRLMKLSNCEECEVESSPNTVGAVFDEDLREVYLTGVIDDGTYQTVTSAIRHLDKTRGNITLFINTGGGEIRAGMAIADAVKCTKNKVIAQCFGGCMSMGMVILQACDTRLSAPSCRFMVHEASGGVADGPLSRVKQSLAEMSTVDDLLDVALAERSELPLEQIKALSKAETFMSAEVAMDYGFLDGILGQVKKTVKKGKKK
jgi:ATP-dependent Clp protease protease subunit